MMYLPVSPVAPPNMTIFVFDTRKSNIQQQLRKDLREKLHELLTMRDSVSKSG